MIHVFSRGIARIKHLQAFLDEPCSCPGLISRPRPGPGDKVAGWGLKPTSRKARDFAARHGLPFLTLEDGFLRSLGLGVMGFQPCSLIVDSTGIYYDASRPSDLELLLAESELQPQLLQRATGCMQLIREQRLSKYNHAPDQQLFPDTERPRILVVDQTFADASVLYGGGDQQIFELMLDQAIAENPEAEVLVKVHPDVIAGKKQGYLLQPARQRNCRVISQDINPWALFDAVHKVYVLSSQLGFEALMAGKEVVCFGKPFYAGWGLTRDMQTCPRRTVQRSLQEVFAAAYLLYPRYVNPYTGQPCQAEDIIHLLADQRRQARRFAGPWLACGFSGWKKGFVGDFLGPWARVAFCPMSLDQVRAKLSPASRVLAWSTSLSQELQAFCQDMDLELWRMEDGFVRSKGLGVDLVRPMSLVLDSRGIYYDPSSPSDLEQILDSAELSPSLLRRAAAVRRQLVEQGLSKYNVGKGQALDLPRDKRLILVPGQVETDASITRGSSWIRTNQALLQEVRKQNPQAFVLYKPHPDVQSAGRKGALPQKDPQGLYDLLLEDISISELLSQVHEVHTMSSLAGFEALLRGVQVSTYGLPFYAGWGLTRDMQTCPRRTRRLSLDELVAGTLILYPVYVEPRSGHICNIETIIQLLVQARQSPAPKLAWPWRLYRWLKFQGII